MSIPKVNDLVIDWNREQSKRICELSRGNYKYMDNRFGEPVADSLERKRIVHLPHGSFTLCQVVQMLDAEGYHLHNDGSGYGYYKTSPHGGFYVNSLLGKLFDNPHDLTAAMDALIKALERKS